MHRPWHVFLTAGMAGMLCAAMAQAADPAAQAGSQAGSPTGIQAALPPAGARGSGVQVNPGTETVTLNFVNADIEGVIRAVSEFTGRNFLLDPRVKGTVNIVSARPMSRSMVYQVFLSALRLQGFAALEDRGIVKIVPESDARLHGGAALAPGERARTGADQIQTQVFTLKYESATQLVPILRPMVSPSNPITAYQASNALVITDYASNLQRIERIIESIDQPSGNDPVILPLKHASALDVAQTLNRLLSDTPAQGAPALEATQRVTVVADARSNSIIVRSDNPSRITRLRGLVASLDSPTSAAGNIHVVYMKNAEAVKVAETLRAIYAGSAAAARPPAATAAGTALPPLGAAIAPPLTPAANAPTGIIQADAATNSIIITAPDAVYNDLRAAIDKLDRRRAQVYIEALIAEVSAQTAAEFGIQWQELGAVGTTDTAARGFGGTNFGTTGQNILGIAQNPATVGRGLNIGVLRGRVSIPGLAGQALNVGLLVRALETNGNTNILSTPTLLTLDNEEARIVVGQNVPFLTGQYAVSGAATTPTPFQTIERRDVGLTLKIRPQISEGGTVRLQIYQEVSSVQDSTNAAGVVTSKRSVESAVLVDDGQMVVIGGLIQDSLTDSIEKVPGLGDIPIIGGLFQYRSRARGKTNLMVFLRPTVLRDANSADALTGERYEYILGEQARTRPAPHPLLPEGEPPGLPLRLSPLAPDGARPR